MHEHDLDALQEGATQALAAGEPARARALLAPWRGRLGVDARLDRLWLEALRADPSAPGASEDVARIVEAHPADADLVVRGAAVWLRLAEARPPDEPPLAEGPAARALAAVDRCLALAGAGLDAELRARLVVHRANALRWLGPARDAEAREAFEQALAARPDDGGFWFDLALLHKWRGRFAEALGAFERARGALGETRAVLWNVAICATALGRGAEAAAAWTTLGLAARVNAAGMPVVDGVPPLEVRVPARGPGHAGGALPDRARRFEVVRVAPLSPCHGVVVSPTFEDTPVDHGDVVLWDGAPVGLLREADGGVRPRFPLLEVLRRGDERRFRVIALRRGEGADAALEALAAALPEGAVLAWHRAQVETVAHRDALGSAHRAEAPAQEGPVRYGKLVLPRAAELAAVRDTLERTNRGRAVQLAVPGLYEELGDAKRAGVEHQAWRGIERRAERGRGDA